MQKAMYEVIEAHMQLHMKDVTHDRHHIYRVLNAAVDIAGREKDVDMDVLVAACLLHDIGREAQAADLSLCHAHIGGDMAYDFLRTLEWKPHKARHVKDCIQSHRYRRGNPPKSKEAKILFDADKLEAAGAVGIARTFTYGGQVGEPIYILDEDGNITEDGGGADISSFFQEYNYKLIKVYDRFHTKRARKLAMKRRQAAADFYAALHGEISGNIKRGIRQVRFD
jgi:uncharacterized protein